MGTRHMDVRYVQARVHKTNTMTHHTPQQGECCPGCFLPSRDRHIGGVDVAVPEDCRDEDCSCHTPTREKPTYETATPSQKKEMMEGIAKEVNAEQKAIVEAYRREKASVEECTCRSSNRPDIGETPETILDPNEYFDWDSPVDKVAVDECIADEVLALWEAGIWTKGSCCGHNDFWGRSIILDESFVGVIPFSLVSKQTKLKQWRLVDVDFTATIRAEAKREVRCVLSEELRGDGPCSYCGTKDVPRWYTDNVFWNAVMRDSLVANERNDRKGEGFCCIACFVKHADEAGFYPGAWRVFPDWPWREKAPTDTTSTPNPPTI